MNKNNRFRRQYTEKLMDGYLLEINLKAETTALGVGSMPL